MTSSNSWDCMRNMYDAKHELSVVERGGLIGLIAICAVCAISVLINIAHTAHTTFLY